MVSIALNPYKNYARCELMVGYNLPIIDRGGIYLVQVADDGSTEGISGAVNIKRRDISATYDYKAIRSAPYCFGGVFVGLLLGFGGSREISR